MCVGIPMQVRRLEPGFAWCEGRGERRRVRTLLVEPVRVDDWLLVFLDDARERIDAERAEQIDQALDLVDQALAGSYSAGASENTPTASLPSALSLEQINRLTGGAS